MSDAVARSQEQPGGPDAGRVPALLTVEEAARLLRIGRNTCYELIHQQRIPHVRLGRLIRVPRAGLENWIARETCLPQPEPPVVLSPLPQR